VVVVFENLLRLCLGHGPILDGLAQLGPLGNQMLRRDLLPPPLRIVDRSAVLAELVERVLLRFLDTLNLRVVVGLSSVNIITIPRYGNISGVRGLLCQSEAHQHHHQTSLHCKSKKEGKTPQVLAEMEL